MPEWNQLMPEDSYRGPKPGSARGPARLGTQNQITRPDQCNWKIRLDQDVWNAQQVGQSCFPDETLEQLADWLNSIVKAARIGTKTKMPDQNMEFGNSGSTISLRITFPFKINYQVQSWTRVTGNQAWR